MKLSRKLNETVGNINPKNWMNFYLQSANFPVQFSLPYFSDLAILLFILVSSSRLLSFTVMNDFS